ncbi:helix-turn-helix transcriptional regulator [Pseudomonas typographi]|uniref:helix-turn-helix transcriptional regulator n=1 Tax=Pseudomonas typographi TaxID=2715964 RepID=UPI0016840825|nr:helix-turn-helix transcriptional regulator [Pseudomonas typographi]MBD1553589.1 helix-turn-helix transcriptional regulator [Pseudomonas typographi]
MGRVISFANFTGRTGFLAEQELRVALTACAGMSQKEAARAIGCSPSSVKKSFERAFSKLRVANKASLVAEVLRRGLISFASGAHPGHGPHKEPETTNCIFIA